MDIVGKTAKELQYVCPNDKGYDVIRNCAAQLCSEGLPDMVLQSVYPFDRTQWKMGETIGKTASCIVYHNYSGIQFVASIETE